MDKEHSDGSARDATELIIVQGLSEDGLSYEVTRKKGTFLERGAMLPLKQGKSIHGEIVYLRARSPVGGIFDVIPQCGVTTLDDDEVAAVPVEYRKKSRDQLRIEETQGGVPELN